ncbi:MAG: SRPBCC domain-containing protein [Balneola sp.]
MISFEITEHFPVSSKELYTAWLDSHQHSAMTGGEAICSNKEGERFSAWDRYITGTNRKLVEGKEILQSWRTTEFDDAEEDSELILKFVDTEVGCTLTLTHTNIPENQPDYKHGWIEHYFEPMKEYFATR